MYLGVSQEDSLENAVYIAFSLESIKAAPETNPEKSCTKGPKNFTGNLRTLREGCKEGQSRAVEVLTGRSGRGGGGGTNAHAADGLPPPLQRQGGWWQKTTKKIKHGNVVDTHCPQRGLFGKRWQKGGICTAREKDARCTHLAKHRWNGGRTAGKNTHSTRLPGTTAKGLPILRHHPPRGMMSSFCDIRHRCHTSLHQLR